MPAPEWLLRDLDFDPVQEYENRINDVALHGVVYGVREGHVTYEMVRKWGVSSSRHVVLIIWKLMRGDDDKELA